MNNIETVSVRVGNVSYEVFIIQDKTMVMPIVMDDTSEIEAMDCALYSTNKNGDSVDRLLMSALRTSYGKITSALENGHRSNYSKYALEIRCIDGRLLWCMCINKGYGVDERQLCEYTIKIVKALNNAKFDNALINLKKWWDGSAMKQAYASYCEVNKPNDIRSWNSRGKAAVRYISEHIKFN